MSSIKTQTQNTEIVNPPTGTHSESLSYLMTSTRPYIPVNLHDGIQAQEPGQPLERAETPRGGDRPSTQESSLGAALARFGKLFGRDYVHPERPSGSSVPDTTTAPETPSPPATDRSAMWEDVQRRRISQVLPTENLSGSYCLETGTPSVSTCGPSKPDGPTWQEVERDRARRESDAECEKVFQRVSQNPIPRTDPPFLRKISLSTHLNKVVDKAKSRVRKRSAEVWENIRDVASLNYIPRDERKKFFDGEKAFINQLIFLAMGYGRQRYVGYINTIADKLGLCSKTGYRAIEKAEELGLIKHTPGPYNPRLGRREFGTIVLLPKLLLHIRQFFSSGLLRDRSNKKERFFVRPRPITQPVMAFEGSKTGPPPRPGAI